MELVALITLTVIIGALVMLVASTVAARHKETQETSSTQQHNMTAAADPATAEESVSKSPASKKVKQEKQRPRKERAQQHTFSHPLLAAALKGHSGNVTCLDFSSNGKYLASCSDDRTIRIWSTKDFLEREHKCLRANVELDHATLVRFSPDSRAFITWLANGDTIRVFKMLKKEDGSFSFKAAPDDFPVKHKASILNIGIAETGKFIMSAYTDTNIHIWDLKGDVLATINTNQMNNAYAAISPCGRFVASCGFTPDVKVWEVCFGKGGDFKEVTRAFDLKGHSAGVHCFAFSNDSHRMATVSKDGTWKLWNTNVEYKKQQDPYVLTTAPCDVASEGECGCRVALSPDGRVVAVSHGRDVAMYDGASGRLEEDVRGVHGEEIVDLRFDVTGRFLACTGDRAVRLLHNTPGYRACIRDMQDMLRKAQNEAMKERLRLQITDAQNALDGVMSAAVDDQC